MARDQQLRAMAGDDAAQPGAGRDMDAGCCIAVAVDRV
jgi:hypothetical protein